MKNLSSLLSRIKESLGKNVVAKDAILESVRDTVGFMLLSDDVLVKNDTLEVKASPAKKNEIVLREQKILEAINARTGLSLKRIFYK